MDGVGSGLLAAAMFGLLFGLVEGPVASWGPRVFGIRGLPTLEPLRGHLADAELAARVWTASAGLTGLDPSWNLG
ncbi:hypothetical protein [Nonomuraea recticatena]|uniref:Uncharacterized protein n=1 Tax=Nonomuraea recticatena TaxID=46178 RepID=A0ABN3S8B5_9ACTN